MLIYLTGDIVLERAGQLVTADALPGLQGRIVLAMLVAEHRRPVSRDELAEELWGEASPVAWEAGLRAVISKVRAAITPLAPPGWPLITTADGHYQFRLPPDGAIDSERAHRAVHAAEAALRRADVAGAGAQALVASMIARRPFLVGATGPWAERQQAWLLALRVRALEVLASVWTRLGDPAQAARDAQTVVELEPYRESAYRLLIEAHGAAGNQAQAVAAYHRCQRVLQTELSVAPSAATEAVYRQILSHTG